MSQSTTIDRYPGLRPFDETERAMFFGRSIELEDICQSVNVNDLFVIHGESGLGKSSLINAGLIPLLREKNFFPILLRIKDRNRKPLQQVIDELKKLNTADKPEKTDDRETDNLWYLIKLFNRERLKPILIFDQFEEFGYYSEADREELIRELAVLLVSRIPDYGKNISVEHESKGEISEETGNEIKKFSWYSQPEVKLIFSLRSDRMSILEDFASLMPSVLRARYQLKPILLNQVEQIIVIPAILETTETISFTTRCFQYQPELIRDIIDVVTDKKRNTIETTQLQMICQEIELMVKARQQKNETNITITKNDLGKNKLEELVNNFYKKQLERIEEDKSISREEYAATRILIEKRLLAQKKRVPLAEGTIFQYYMDYFREKEKHISDDKVKYIRDSLLNLRLIRDQNYGDAVFYEISHDTLIEPIETERIKRESEEKQREDNIEKRKREKEISDQRKHIQEIEKQRNIAQKALKKAEKLKAWITIILTAFIIMAVIVLAYYFRQNEKNKLNLATLYSTEAEKNYKYGNHQLAYKYWQDAFRLTGNDSIKKILQDTTFAAFAGTWIYVSYDLNYIATKYDDHTLHLWKAGENNAEHLAPPLYFPEEFRFGFLPDNRMFWIVDTSSFSTYSLKDRKKNKSVDLDSFKLTSSSIVTVVGNYFWISNLEKGNGNRKTAYFSILTGKPLRRVNKFFDSTRITLRSTSILLGSDSSIILYPSLVGKPTLIDLENDMVEYLDNEAWVKAIGHKSQVAFWTRRVLNVYDLNSHKTKKFPYSYWTGMVYPVAFIDSDSGLLVRHYTPDDILVLYQLNIKTGKVIKIATDAYIYNVLKNDRYYLYIDSDSILNLVDSRNGKTIKKMPHISEIALSADKVKLLCRSDSTWILIDPFDFRQDRTFKYEQNCDFVEAPYILFEDKDTLLAYNYSSKIIRKIPTDKNSLFDKFYDDKFIQTYAKKREMYYLNFTDSIKMTPRYLQAYFKRYLINEFKELK